MKEKSPNHYLDTRTLFDYCFENYQLWNVAENEKKYTEGAQELKIFENEESFIGLNQKGCIVLPVAVNFEDAVPKISETHNDDQVVGRIEYTYANRNVGGTDIEITGAKVTEFNFQKKMEIVPMPEKKVIRINIKYVVIGFVSLIFLIGLGFGIYHLVDNFYLIRYKFESRRQQRQKFKEIKGRRRHRRK